MASSIQDDLELALGNSSDAGLLLLSLLPLLALLAFLTHGSLHADAAGGDAFRAQGDARQLPANKGWLAGGCCWPLSPRKTHPTMSQLEGLLRCGEMDRGMDGPAGWRAPRPTGDGNSGSTDVGDDEVAAEKAEVVSSPCRWSWPLRTDVPRKRE